MFTPLIFFISFVIRLFLVPLPGFKADIAYWKWWGMSAAHDGISGPLVNTAYNYPSFYLYILKFTSHLYEWLTGFNFKLTPNDPTFWSDSNFLYLLLIKLPYILADLGIGILIYKIIKNSNIEALNSKQTTKSKFLNYKTFRISIFRFRISSYIPLIAASLFLFNPVVIYNSSIWGQTDSLGAFLVLLAFYFLLTTRFSLLAIFAAIALFMKVQTVIFLPILFLVVLLRSDFKETIKSLWVFTATAIVINLPFLITHTMSRVFEVMYSSQAYFPYVSMNAYNLWWLFFGRLSSSYWDQNLIFGLISFKMLGLVLFGSVYTIAISLVCHPERTSEARKSRDLSQTNSGVKDSSTRPDSSRDLVGMTKGIILVSFAFFLLLTQMHERYLFPLFVFFPILIGVTYCSSVGRTNNLENFSLRSKNTIILTTIYLILSATTLLNLHQVMIMNYPDNTFPLLPNTFSEPLTRVIAFINVIIFIVLAALFISSSFWGAKRLQNRFWTSQNDVRVIGLTLFGVFFLLFIISLPKIWLYSKPIIYLSQLSPSVAYQGYGTLQKNKSVGGGWLSSLYYFFDKGLGTHANSQIVYNLDSRYQNFTTNFGIDTEANEAASVIFIIKGDGKTLFVSPKMTRFSLPGFAKVSVANVKNLELDVTDAGDGINSDHADWLEPKLYK